MKTKEELRIEQKGKAKAYQENEKTKANDLIFAFLTSQAVYQNARSIFLYKSTDFEVDTERIILDALSKGKEVFTPKIEKREMLGLKVDENTSYKRNKSGILEPIEGETAEQFDICLIPLVAFDRNKNRLGHGGGFYDRFLANFVGVKIALAFSFQEEENIPCNENDIAVDMIITEKEIIK